MTSSTDRPKPIAWTTVLLARAIGESAERDGAAVSARTSEVADLPIPEDRQEPAA